VREKRQDVRIPMCRPVTVYTSHGTSMRAEIVDLSLHGIAIMYPAPTRQGRLFTLEFRLTVKEQDYILKLQGEVRYVHLVQNTYRIGLEFVEPPADELKTIDEFIHDRIRTTHASRSQY
jgi:c-di-GMP-binding flagellar brake protein YcgR